MIVSKTVLKRPAFEAEFDARGLMPLLLAVNNFNFVISYVLWVIIYILSQKKKQTHLSYRETYKQVVPLLLAHGRNFGGIDTKKDKEAKEIFVKTILDSINLTI
jgi:hypothetical protein